MESRRFLLAITLMIATVVIVNILFPPPKPEPGVVGAGSIAAPASPDDPNREPEPAATMIAAVLI